LQTPFDERDDIISVSDELKHGTPKEIRDNIGLIASMLESGAQLDEPYRSWIVDAMREISSGADASTAFGLNRGKAALSPAYVKETCAMATDLINQGMTDEAAWDFLARYDDEKGVMRNPAAHPGPAFKKKIERAYKHIFESIPKTK